jgi:nucleoside-diphosphate-sugar epimerase
MARTALIIGGSGQIGRAVARRLRTAGWRVIAAQRNPGEVTAADTETIILDRDQPGALAKAVGQGVDALIDTVAYDERDARQLLEIQSGVGAFVVISSASVYRDAQGRTLDEARQTGFPRFPQPIGEDQPTVPPGPETYSTRKVALEQAVLQGATRPVTIIRPGAIHGPGSRHPREWWFIKRILDGRRRVPLAFAGQSRFQTSATVNIAEVCQVALRQPGTRILHAADPEAPTVSAIGEAIARVYGHPWALEPMAGPPDGPVGSHPWCLPHPILLDMTRAHALGYRPAAAYADHLAETCRSAEAASKAGAAFPAYLTAMFDYAAEDAWFERHV